MLRLTSSPLTCIHSTLDDESKNKMELWSKQSHFVSTAEIWYSYAVLSSNEVDLLRYST